jgi:hypothetical protein
VSEILSIEATVLIDGSDIDFIGSPGDAVVSQLAIISVQGPEPAPARVGQLAIVSVQQSPPQPAFVSQLARIIVVGSNRKSICLGNPIKLNCWQPCTAFGTDATIVYLGGNAK